VDRRFPIYIISKGRAESRLTAKALEAAGVPYRIVVEPQEMDTYAAVIDRAKIIEMDMQYIRDFDCCDDLGDSKPPGCGPARNFVWDHAVAEGHEWFWMMDDNIRGFYRFHQNQQIKIEGDACFRAMEDFSLRFANVACSGPQYYMFAPRKVKVPPFYLNCRVYSCYFVRATIPFRFRARYNDDTDFNLRVMKAGWCTILFNAFLQYKMRTSAVAGGLTKDFYDGEGTLPKSEMIVRLHPDVTRLAWRFGRAHHYVDYSRFRKTPLIRRHDQPEEPASYPMRLTGAAS
jgi:hypothetical protein